MIENSLIHPGEAINRNKPVWNNEPQPSVPLHIINGGKK